MNANDPSVEKIRSNQREAIRAELETLCDKNRTLHENGFRNILVNNPKPNPLDLIAADYEKAVWEVWQKDPKLQDYMTGPESYIVEVNNFIKNLIENRFTQLIKDIDTRMRRLELFSPSQPKDKAKKVIQLIEMWSKTKFTQIDNMLFDAEIRYETENNKDDFKQRLRSLRERFDSNQISEMKQKMIKQVAAKFNSTYEYLSQNPRQERKPVREPSKIPPNPWLPPNNRHSMSQLAEVVVHEDQRRLLNQSIQKIEADKAVIIGFWKDELRLQRPKTGVKEVEEEIRPAIIFGFSLRQQDTFSNPRLLSLIPRLALYSIDFESLFGLQIESIETSTGFRALMSCKIENVPDIIESYINNYTEEPCIESAPRA